MNRSQAKELFTLITMVRHVEKMNTVAPAKWWADPVPGCLLCEGVRHGLYTEKKGDELDTHEGFAPHFGCTKDEADRVIYHNHISWDSETTGEIYYKAGKELIIKYGYTDLFETTLSFADIMTELRQSRCAA